MASTPRQRALSVHLLTEAIKVLTNTSGKLGLIFSHGNVSYLQPASLLGTSPLFSLSSSFESGFYVAQASLHPTV